MKRILLSLFAIVFFLPSFAFAEIQTVTKTIRQTFGGSQSADDARIAAVARAKREALELAGSYVEALTVVKESRLDKDEILAVTAGVCQSELLSTKNYASDDAFGVEVNVRVTLDTSVLEGRVKKLLADRNYLEQLNSARKDEKELLLKIAKLEVENRNLKATAEEKQRIKEGFRQTSQWLAAMEWFDKAMALRKDKKKSDLQAAIRYLDQAISLKPDYGAAYRDRGTTYANLGQYARAIEDFNQAIRLKLDDAKAYRNRGIVYGRLVQHVKALEDINQAIRLKPDDAVAFSNRGIVYGRLGQHARAIEDHDQAIRLKPDDATAFAKRAIAYERLGQYARAIEDYDQAIRLKPDYFVAFVTRGIAYRELGQYDRAIEDFNQAIRLKPDDTLTFVGRGIAYRELGLYDRSIEDFNLAIRLKPGDALFFGGRGAVFLRMGQNSQGCRDVSTACNLGDCSFLEDAKREGWCNAVTTTPETAKEKRSQ